VSATIPVRRCRWGWRSLLTASAYVNYVDGTVSVIDTASAAVSATIGVRQGALGMAATPDGKHVYVATRTTAPCR
jgi:YVTN family beta-propeller protein